MATIWQDLGEVQGKPGEAGPANKVIASVYTYALGDDPNTIPEGPWTSSIPQLELGDESQGKYVFCRSQLTWDQGPDTDIVTVGYIGRNGEFEGSTQLVSMQNSIQELKDRITPISKGGTEASTLEGAQAKLGITGLKSDLNAFKETTASDIAKATEKSVNQAKEEIPAAGINLLRGTRDFTKGNANKTFGSYPPDGFNMTEATVVNDEYGFSSISINSSTASRLYCSVIVPDKNEHNTNELTISFYIMIENGGTINNQANFMSLAIQKFNINSDVAIKNYSLSDSFNVGNVSEIVNNRWYKCVINFSNTWNADYDFYCLVFRNNIGSTVRIKKIKVEYGYICNPTWSESPFDIAQYSPLKQWLNLIPDEYITEKIDINDLVESKVYCLRTGSESSLNRPNNATPYAFITNINPFNDNRRIQFWLNWNDNINNIHLYGRIRAQEKTYGDWKQFF